MPTRSIPWRRALPAAVLLAEVLVFYRLVLFTSAYVIPHDLRTYHLGPAFFVAKCLRQGELPLWDPYTYCGFPIYANPQVQLFYPPAWITFALSWLFGQGSLLKLLEWQIAGHVFLGGLFTYWLLRRLRLSRTAALLGGTIFQLGGFFASQAQHLGAMSGAAWLPLVWLCVLEVGRRFRWRWLALLAAGLAMAILAGFPAVTAVVVGSGILLALILVLLRQAPVKLLAAVAVACVWAGLLAAVQLLPTAELVRLSTAPLRGQWGNLELSGIPLRGLVSLVIPNFNRIFDLKQYTLPWNPTFLYLYCGLPGLLLAAAALARWRDKNVRIFALLTLLAALGMLGSSTPVERTLFPLLPATVRAPLYPEFAMAAFVLGMAVLAALGAERWFAGASGALPAIVVALAAVDLIAAGSGRPMNTVAVKDDPGVSYEVFEGSRETLARVRGLVNQSLPPARIDIFDDSYNWASSAPMLEVPTAGGNDPLALTRLLAVRRCFAPGPEWVRYLTVSALDSPLVDLLNIRYLLTWAPSEALVLKHPKFPKVVTLPGHHVHENRAVLPRFYLVGQVQRASDLEEARATVCGGGFDPRRTAVVEGIAGDLRLTGAGAVRVLRYGRGEVDLEVDSHGAAFLVTSEVHYPGWRAFVDGVEQPLVMTNAAFRGLPVAAGRHRVTMRFAPAILGHGFALSAAAWGLLLLALSKRQGERTASH